MSEVFSTQIVDGPLPGGPNAATTDGLGHHESKVEVPLSMYSSINNKTYTEQFFGLERSNQEGVDVIERFVKEQIEDRGLKNTTEVYDRILSEIFDKLGIDKDEEMSNKFFKAHTYVKMLGKMELLKTLQDGETLDQKIAKLLERRKI